MGFLSHRVDRSELKAGDHIYTWRTAFAYSHHGIYVGGNKVVHFTTGEKVGLGSAFSSSDESVYGSCLSSPDCGFKKPGSGVVLSCLNCFIGSGSLYLYRYGMKTYVHFSRLRGGTCTVAESDPPEQVIYRAMYLLQNGFGSYNLVLNNCETFALYCKTSLVGRDQPVTVSSGQVHSWVTAPLNTIATSTAKWFISTRLMGGGRPITVSSGQVGSWVSVPLTAVVTSTKFICSSSLASVVTTAGMHCYSRYMNDIGVRDDVIKVKVEDITLFQDGTNL
uniref:protein LEAD-SENSITIVE 1-like n=1 Tax=Erigeron canadensis TaxID=72917 RepID=UPI001CB8AD0E|nr:protein LEAD-SENSITIVE 1-like [Erigeron canadensis]